MGDTVLLVTLGVVAGITAGTAAALVWQILGLPIKLLANLHLTPCKIVPVCLVIGLLLAAVYEWKPIGLPLQTVGGVISIFLGGWVVGMMSCALAEVAEITPFLLDQLGADRQPLPFAICLAVGKFLGALAAGYI